MMNPFLLAVETGDRISAAPIIAGVGALVVLVALIVLPKILKKNDDNDNDNNE